MPMPLLHLPDTSRGGPRGFLPSCPGTRTEGGARGTSRLGGTFERMSREGPRRLEARGHAARLELTVVTMEGVTCARVGTRMCLVACGRYGRGWTGEARLGRCPSERREAQIAGRWTCEAACAKCEGAAVPSAWRGSSHIPWLRAGTRFGRGTCLSKRRTCRQGDNTCQGPTRQTPWSASHEGPIERGEGGA